MKIKRGDIINVIIESLSFGGSGFTKYDGIAIFVDKGLPGQELKIKLLRKYQNYFKAVIIEVIKETDVLVVG